MNPSDDRPPDFLDEQKSLACIHCGLCLGACPTYLETGNENESPRGRIYIMRAMQDGRLPVDGPSIRHIDLCLGCRACEAACPSGVQYGTLLEQTRDFIESNYHRSPYQKFLRRVFIEKIIPHPGRMRVALWPGRMMKAMGVDKWLPGKLREPLEMLPDKCSAWEAPEFSPAARDPAKGRVGFIRGCVMGVMFGETNRASIQLLNRAGYDVVTPRAQSCCGALFAHGGGLAEAREQARKNIAAFEDEALDAIVINAAGCGSTLKEYGHLLHGDPEWSREGEEFSARVQDLTEFLAGQGVLDWEFSRTEKRITYHDACHLAHPQRITKQPRDLVKAVARESFVELPESDVCCGSAGSYNLTEPAMAERLRRRKIENIARSGADVVVTTNPGCILQIQAGIRKSAGKPVEVMHLADFLAHHLPKQDAGEGQPTTTSSAGNS